MNIPLSRARLILGPELAGTLMTVKEFDAVEEYDENYRYELIRGVLVVTPFPLAEETDPNEELGYWLRSYQEHHRRGRALDATMPQRYIRTRTSCRLADRVIWAGLGRLPKERTDPPTIAAEFVSAARRDRRRDSVEKRREYMKAGVAEYWIIDRFRRTLTVVRKKGGRIQDVVIAENETYRPALLPGFELPLGRLLAVADRWADRGGAGSEE